MKFSVALHLRQPGVNGNQRDMEAAYQGYNRTHIDLVVDPVTGDAMGEFDCRFPLVQADQMAAFFYTFGMCQAAPSCGGRIVIVGHLNPPMLIEPGKTPVFQGATMIENRRLKELDLVVYEGGKWRERTPEELAKKTWGYA